MRSKKRAISRLKLFIKGWLIQAMFKYQFFSLVEFILSIFLLNDRQLKDFLHLSGKLCLAGVNNDLFVLKLKVNFFHL